ncbi:MAG TPA: S24 family peptidase [Chthoniobacterales bacterium]
MGRPISQTLTSVQQRVADKLADFARQERPALVGDLVKVLGLAGESSLTPTLQKMARNGFVEIQRAGLQGRSRVVKLTPKGRLAMGIGGLPLLGFIPAGPLSEAVPQADRMVETRELLGDRPGDFLLRVRGDSMIGDGILDGDFVLIRPEITVPNGTIAAVCVGDDREGTLKRVHFEGENVRLQASNPAFADIVVSADQVHIAGLLRGVVRHVGAA